MRFKPSKEIAEAIEIDSSDDDADKVDKEVEDIKPFSTKRFQPTNVITSVINIDSSDDDDVFQN